MYNGFSAERSERQLNKYRAKKSDCCQGHLHDSKKEAYRCDLLHILQKYGKISDLQIQVKFELVPAQKFQNMPNERAVTYIADFVYTENGLTIIEDTKGVKTKDYIIKRKLLKQKFCQDGKTVFREVTR